MGTYTCPKCGQVIGDSPVALEAHNKLFHSGDPRPLLVREAVSRYLPAYCKFSDMSDADREIMKRVGEALPHGSGIDSDWQLSASPSYFIASNEYHAMNENGMYVGWAPFTIKIPRTSDDFGHDFILQFNGRQSQYLASRHGLRDYLGDMFAEALSGIRARAR